MRVLIKILFISLLSTGFMLGQAAADFENPDPEAVKILQSIKDKVESYRSLEVFFDLTIEMPEQDKQVQKGWMVQQDDMYRFELGGQSLYNNGKLLWVHLTNNNEVQINNINNNAGGINTPRDFLTIYEKEDFFYALVNQGYENGIPIQQIEFKPLDKKSEYSKIRLTINSKTKAVIRIKAFFKNNMRYTFDLRTLNHDKVFEPGFFTFDPTKHEGIYVEDLRID